MVSWLLAVALSAATANPWASQQFPAPGHPDAIGTYTAGCLQGAVPLPETGTGYQLLRPSHRRFYGHPVLIAYLQQLARRSHTVGLPDLLIGDLAMPKGGPFTSGHKSHQSGLDADVWFRFAPSVLSRAQREAATPLDLVDGQRNRVNRQFSPQHLRLLQLAAEDARVERIFVNPAIKLAACQALQGKPHGWLAKLRPWFGHSAHMHVRLRCPAGNDCQPQAPVPAGDGCGEELLSWFEPPKPASGTATVKAPSPQPAQCRALLTP
ncbi:penicillin-insensitive murein endopeptidase [Pseudaeromonas sp. ZJS20]|uniref:penicillin-insensitive murein endopeptidase n=1 Tax=Pseudaeromonas aegiceratis TaxID=3153928 RepID=UPI00390CA06E